MESTEQVAAQSETRPAATATAEPDYRPEPPPGLTMDERLEIAKQAVEREKSNPNTHITCLNPDGTVTAEFNIRRRVNEPISAERKAEACAEMTDGATSRNELAPPPKLITRAVGEPSPNLLGLFPARLIVTSDNCIAVTRFDNPDPIGVIWGHGWTAGWDQGKAVVYDAAGKASAREGDRIPFGAPPTEIRSWAPQHAEHPCATDQMVLANG